MKICELFITEKSMEMKFKLYYLISPNTSVSDITGGKPKTICQTLFETFWSIGVMILPLLAHLVKSWTHLYMAISWPTVILIILWR